MQVSFPNVHNLQKTVCQHTYSHPTCIIHCKVMYIYVCTIESSAKIHWIALLLTNSVNAFSAGVIVWEVSFCRTFKTSGFVPYFPKTNLRTYLLSFYICLPLAPPGVVLHSTRTLHAVGI